MIKKLACLLIAVFLVVNLMAGISFVHSVETPPDNVYRHERTDTDNFTVLQEDNDQDDFKNYVVTSDGSTVYFKAHYAPNQNYAGSKGVRLFALKKDNYQAQLVSNSESDTISELDQFIFLDENSLLFDGAVGTPAQQGLFKANFSAKSIEPIKEVDTLSSIITKTLFIGAHNEGLLSVTKNYEVTEKEVKGGKIYFPLTFSKDYEGDINVMYQNGSGISFGKLDQSNLNIEWLKDLTKSDTPIEGTSLSFYFDGTNTVAVQKEGGKYSILFEGKPVYQTTINGRNIIGNKKSLFVYLKEKLQKIDEFVESLFISASTGFYVKEGKIFSFTVSDDSVTNVGAIYTAGDASEILTFNSGNLIMKTCNKYSKICSVKRMDDKKVSTLIEDTDNDKGNWDYLLLPLTYPGFEFAVLVHADSSNPFILKFALKPPVTCFGILNKDADVCSGNGLCIAENKCECTGNFAGEKCDKCTPKFEGKYCSDPKIHKCYGVQANSSNVCGGKRGTCLSENNCECRVEYFGNECEHTYCFGVPSISTTKTVCGGKGACVDYNECKCEDKYSGSMCEYYENTLVSTRGLYPIMITYGVISLVTVVGLLMLVFCFLGRHRKEYLALYGNRSIISHHDPINGEEDEELDEPHFLEREQQTEQPTPTQNKPQGQEYALDESDEDL